MTDNETYAIELTAPDISAYRASNTGVDWFHTFDSGKSGPHVGVTAVTHGNELCGAISLDWLLRHDVRPIAGKLTLGFVNVEAYMSFDPENPVPSRFVDEDFNRLWADEVIHEDTARDTSEMRRARAIQPVIHDLDYLLDIHSMQQPSPSLMMCGPRVKGLELGTALATTEWCIADWGHAAGRRMRDYAPFIDESSPRNSLLVECGQHWEASSETVSHHTVVRYLTHFGCVEPDSLSDLASSKAGPVPIEAEVSGPYTMKTDKFEFAKSYQGMETIPKAGTVIGYDDGEEVITPYDNAVLVMPTKRRAAGQSAVRFAHLKQTL